MIYLPSMILMLQNQLDIDENCRNFKSLPDIKINLKSRKYENNNEYKIESITLKPEDYIIEGKKIKKRLEGIDKEFLSYAKEECQEAFMPIDVPRPRGPIFVFGEYFLRKFYTVFDRDRNLMGFSLANHYSKDINYHNLNIKTPYDDIDTDELIKIPNFKNNNFNENMENDNNKNNYSINDNNNNYNNNNEVKNLQKKSKQYSLDNNNNNDNIDNNQDNLSNENNKNNKDLDDDVVNLDDLLLPDSPDDNINNDNNNNNKNEISEFEKFNKELNNNGDNNNNEYNSHGKRYNALHLELDIDLI